VTVTPGITNKPFALDVPSVHSCDYCGGDVEHPFSCNYCERSFCGDHRLPENHNCTHHIVTEDADSFGGSGPDTTDRRGTKRKRIERIKKKETSPPNRSQAVAPQSKSDHRSGDPDNTAILTCPTCGEDTDRIKDCEDCGQSVCPDCEGVYEHECPVGVTNDSENNSTHKSDRSIVGRILDIFK